METDSEVDRIQAFVDIGNYHAAFNIALSVLNECRRKNDQDGVDTYLEIIKVIVQVMADEFGSQT